MEKRISTLFILAALILGPLYLAHAQKRAAMPRIGVLSGGILPNANIDVFIQQLRELGYVEGKNILVEYRLAEGRHIVFLNLQWNWSD